MSTLVEQSPLPWSGETEAEPLGDTGDADMPFVIRDAKGDHVLTIWEDYRSGLEAPFYEMLGEAIVKSVNEALSARLTPPAEVVRYDLWCNVDGFLEEDKDPEGEWVRYEDHATALATALERLASRWQRRMSASKDRETAMRGSAEKYRQRAERAEAALGAERAARIEAVDRAKEIATGVLVALRQPPADGAYENDHLEVMQWERDEIWKACGLDIAKDHHGAVLDWIKAAKERAALSQSNPGDAASPKPEEV